MSTLPPDTFVEQFIDGYISCAIWSSNDDRLDPEGHGRPLDNEYGRDDLDANSLTSMRDDCIAFIDDNYADLAEYAEQREVYDAWEHAGHDFWLTRNGHGAGYWDRGLGELGDRLSDAAKVYGESTLDSAGDGSIYVS